MQENKNGIKPGEVAGVAGVATLGIGSIDLRPKAKTREAKYLGSNWKDVRKHVRPGDVMIGANTEAKIIKDEAKDYYARYKSNRKKGMGIFKSIKKAKPKYDVSYVTSKMSDPESSHAVVFSTKKTVSHGGDTSKITKYELPENKTAYKEQLKYKYKPHFVLLRPKPGVSEIPDLYKQRGASTSKWHVSRKASTMEHFQKGFALRNQILDWVLPKFNRKEKVKSQSVLGREACLKGGICSTTPALMSKRTVGGKQAKYVLPKDFLRSADYEVVGKIGKTKTSFGTKMLLSAPKALVKGTAALGVAGLAYGATKGIQSFTKKPVEKKSEMIKKSYLEDAYNAALINELVRLKS